MMVSTSSCSTISMIFFYIGLHKSTETLRAIGFVFSFCVNEQEQLVRGCRYGIHREHRSHIKDLSFNEHIPLIDDVIALVLIAGVTKTGQHATVPRLQQ